jgi:hypothetical protein
MEDLIPAQEAAALVHLHVLRKRGDPYQVQLAVRYGF